jgi:hypothetical protein
VEQRRLRLGDILDDYCPRERRVTNHAIVAMIEDDIKQTRCTTCDAEHAYKGGKAPRRRKKDAPALIAASADAPAAGDAADEDPIETFAADNDVVEPAIESREPLEPQPVLAADENVAPDENTDSAERSEAHAVEDGPVHRPLIRATLPRPEGQKSERPLPDFTVRHATGRGGNATFRGNGRPKMRTHGTGNGGRPHGRFAGPHTGSGRGGSHAGFRSGPPRQGGKKRSR